MKTTQWGQKYRHNGTGAKYVVTSFFILPREANEVYWMLANVDGGYYAPISTDAEQIFGDDRDQFTLIEKK